MANSEYNPWYINTPKLILFFVLKQNNEKSLLKLFKNIWDSHIEELTIITSTMLQDTSNQF